MGIRKKALTILITTLLWVPFIWTNPGKPSHYTPDAKTRPSSAMILWFYRNHTGKSHGIMKRTIVPASLKFLRMTPGLASPPRMCLDSRYLSWSENDTWVSFHTLNLVLSSMMVQNGLGLSIICSNKGRREYLSTSSQPCNVQVALWASIPSTLSHLAWQPHSHHTRDKNMVLLKWGTVTTHLQKLAFTAVARINDRTRNCEMRYARYPVLWFIINLCYLLSTTCPPYLNHYWLTATSRTPWCKDQAFLQLSWSLESLYTFPSEKGRHWNFPDATLEFLEWVYLFKLGLSKWETNLDHLMWTTKRIEHSELLWEVLNEAGSYMYKS